MELKSVLVVYFNKIWSYVYDYQVNDTGVQAHVQKHKRTPEKCQGCKCKFTC